MALLKLLALLLLAVITAFPTGFGGNAVAQEAIIETSADVHDGKFFGEGILRVIVTDPDAEDDGTVEELQINIRAEPESASAATESFMVPETSDSSGRFELFLAHVNAAEIDPDDLDPTNSAGVEGDGTCAIGCAPFVTFGPGGDIDIQSELYEGVAFEITTSNIETKVSYESTIAALKLDRDSYGTMSFVYISVVDQDANLNPTARDEFRVDPDNNPNNDLLVLDGGTFESVVIAFRETGSNTAVFEGRYRLGDSILANSEVLLLTLFDKANYGASLTVPENDSSNIDEISFMVGDTDGTVDIGGGQQFATSDPVIQADKDLYTLGDSVHITIVDQDANVNSDDTDSIQVQVSSRGTEIELAAIETGVNTGIFEVSFELAEETDAAAGTIEPGGSALIIYTDERPDDYSEKVQAGQNPEKDFTLEIDIQLPDRFGVEATGVTAPVAQDAAGGSGPYHAGSSITLSTAVANNNDEPQPFVTIIEVRDSSGATVFLALQAGTLEPVGLANIGVLWRPDKTGTFEVRTFVLSNIIGGVVLSPVASSEITVT